MTCKLAVAFDMLKELENIDVRHCFACCQTCGVHQMESLENGNDYIIGYCLYNEQDADSAVSCKRVYLSYGGYETPDEFWDAGEVARVVVTRLSECGLDVEWDGNTETRIKVTLDDESIDYVAAWSEGFEGGQRVRYDWKFFDFDEHWDAFAEHWYSNKVQTILKESIDRLGIDGELHVGNLFFEDNQHGAWRKGDALWQLSPNHNAYIRIIDDALEGPENPHLAYNRAMKRVNDRLCMTEDRFVHSDIGIRMIYEMARRKRHISGLVYTDEDLDFCSNLDSRYQCFISGMPGRRVIHNALSTVAENMFEGSIVAEVENPQESQLVSLVKENIVFDLVGFYFNKYEGWSSSSVEDVVEMFHLNQMKSGLDV